MYLKILVPLDGSPLASRALPYGLQLANCAKGGLLLLRVTSEPSRLAATPGDVMAESGAADGRMAAYLDPARRSQVLLNGSGPATDTRIEHEVAQAEAYLESVQAELKGSGRPVHIMVRPGAVAETILNTAQTEGVDIIAMSTHGRGGVGRFLLGSVADRVVHHSSAPVLLVRVSDSEQPPQLKRILVALDGSALAASALPQVQLLAQCTGAEVLLLRVAPRLPGAAVSYDIELLLAGLSATMQPQQPLPIDIEIDGVGKPDSAALQDTAREYLAEVAESMSHAGIQVRTLVQIGDAAESILDIAEAAHVDMIAMATHGHSGIRRFITGSVADRVVRHARMPVLLVRPTG